MDDFEIIEPSLEEVSLREHKKSISKRANVQVPSFGSTIIENNRTDGYWIHTLHFDTKKDRVPGVVVSGLASGVIEFLDNPIAEAEAKHTECGCKSTVGIKELEGEWTKYEVGKFDGPVAVIAVDVTGDGLTDLVITHDYGPYMLECNMEGGHITWLQNPGRAGLKDGPWKERYIGRWPAMHRLKAGFFTQKSYLEVVAASIVIGQHDLTTPVPIIRFQKPEKVLEATEWFHDIIDDENFTVIHEITVGKYKGPNGLDSMIIASREGTTWLHYEDRKWKRELVGIGEPKEARQSPTSESPGSGDHWGSGTTAVGKVGDDPFAYIASIDPFHGTTACVYTKVNRGLKNEQWKRHVLDVYGTNNQQMKNGDGPGHFITSGDFDGDGDDEFVVSLFGSLDRDKDGKPIDPTEGPNPNKGIMYYKALDLENGVFAKWRVAEESSARLALGNFGGNGVTDIASITYKVPRYYEEPKAAVTLHLNNFAEKALDSTPAAIIPTSWDGEGMIYIRDPATDGVTKYSYLSVIEIGNYAISVEVYPKAYPVSIPKKNGVKVLYGSIGFFDEDEPYAPPGKDEDDNPLPYPEPVEKRSPFNVPPFTAVTTTSSKEKAWSSNITGAILLRFVPISHSDTYPSVTDVPVATKIDTSSLGVPPPSLEFNKVDNTWWGKGNPFFKDVDFFNLTGCYFRLLESKIPIAHMQFWTAATDVNCGVHNHAGDLFCEMHVCLSPGTKDGGMSRLKPEFNDTDKELNELGPEAFDHLVLKQLEEHGGMWDRDSYDKPVRGFKNAVKYPWHKWQAGKGKDVDLWMALEFNPNLV